MSSKKERLAIYERTTLMYIIVGIRDGIPDCWFTRCQQYEEAETVAIREGIEIVKIESFSIFAMTQRLDYLPVPVDVPALIASKRKRKRKNHDK